MATLRRWYCPRCGLETSSPNFKYYPDDGHVGTPRYGCPRCGDWDIEELEPCPTCDAGWRRKTDRVCEKCRLWAIGKLQRFVRSLSLPIVQALDDELEGGCLEDFRD